MSVCGQSGLTGDDSGSEELPATAAAVSQRDIYKQKPVSKVVRVLTVLAYLLSVSLAAILLSVYYVCVWRSPEVPRANSSGEVSARRDPLLPGLDHHMLPHDQNGRGDSGVKELVVPDESTNVPTSSSTEDTTDSVESTTDFLTQESLIYGSSSNSTNGTEVT